MSGSTSANPRTPLTRASSAAGALREHELLTELATLRAENAALKAHVLGASSSVSPSALHSTSTHAGAAPAGADWPDAMAGGAAPHNPQAAAAMQAALNRQWIASSVDSICVLDMQGHVLQATAHGQTLTAPDGFLQNQSNRWLDWWHADSHATVQAALARSSEGADSRFVAQGHAVNGVASWWDTAVSPITDAQGTACMLLAVSRDVTELHHQDQAMRRFNAELEQRVQTRTNELAEANARLQCTLLEAQLLYEHAPCGYHSLDQDGRFVLINQTELNWLGYTREQVINHMRLPDLLLPAQAPLIAARLEQLRRGLAAKPIEVELVRRDGSHFLVLLSSTAVMDDMGHFVRTNSTMVDISARKAAELALRESQYFLQTIADNVPGLVAYLDTDLRFRFANAEQRRVYSERQSSLLGTHIRDCMHTDTWAIAEPLLRTALDGKTQQFEAWQHTGECDSQYVSTTYLPDLQDGVVRGIFVQVMDITERRLTEERARQLNEELEKRVRERSVELLESEQRYRLMVDNLREYCIYFMNADGVITDWSDSAQRMEGYSPTEMLGQPYASAFGATTRDPNEPSAEHMLRLVASRGQQQIHQWNTRKDGSRYWAHSLLIALRDDDGELRGFAKINRDMTDAKRLDDLLHNLNNELETRVTERTEQLLEANKDLESFSYSVSHDLRSPLRHISSFVSLLEEHLLGQLDDLGARYLGTISSSAKHMSQLIDGLLKFSRLGRGAMEHCVVDLNQLVGAVVTQLAHDTEGRVVEWVLAPDLPRVSGDALLLREVWANLLGNAYKYSRPREHTRIEVGWTTDAATGHTFFVRDNGVGFDPKYSDKLFGVFQRLHRATEFEGTGIGLALTRRIVERHGGRIWADSQLGQGSVFYFLIPFEGPQAPDTPENSMFAETTP